MLNRFPYKLALVFGFAIAQTCYTLSAQAVRTKHCSPAARNNIQAAIAFLKANKYHLKHDFKVGDRKATRRRIRRRIDRKLNKLRFSCAERVLCREGQKKRVAFHALGIASRKIRLCYDVMVDDRYDFCQFTGIVAHEFAHAVGIKKARFGRHERDQNDRVYKFGWYARDLCNAAEGASGRALLQR